MKINHIIKEFVTPQATAQDPALEREKDVDVIFYGQMPQDFTADTVAEALEEVLPREYPPGSSNTTNSNVYRVVTELAKHQGAVVTTKPLSIAQKLVKIFQTYGIKCRIDSPGLDEDVKVPGPMRMNDYYDQADAIQEKLRQAIQTGNKQLIQQLSKQRDDLDAHVKTHGMMPEDITRRGFLQGAGAAAAAGAVGGAMAAPFRHGEYKDQMTGASQGKYSTIKSNDGRASLELSWPGQGQSYLAVDVPGKIINFGASGTAAARIKIGNGPVINTYLNRGTSGNYSWGAIFNNDIINKVLTHQGELKVEIPLYRDGGTVYNFTVEQDQTTKSYSQSNKTQIQQTSRAQEKSDREIALSTAKMPIEEKIKKNIEEFRETLPIDQKIYFRMAGTATFTLHKNGTISNLQWKDQMSVFPNKVAATPDFWQKVMPPLPPIFWGGQSELNVEVFNTGYNTILTVTNVQQSQPVQKNNIPNVQQSQPVQKNNIPQEKIRNWEPEQKQPNSGSGSQSISRESIEYSMAEGTAGLPDPNNFDSDNDYRDALDAYAKPQDNDSDYENWAVDDANESKEKVGNMDADTFDAALARLKKLAGAGPLRTVYDPARRVYKNVPHAVQPAQQPKKAK